ncbi:uncharacterized protein aunip [Synchiropus picturatus]
MASKPVLRTSSQDECGVWLDAVELKDKAKQKKRPMRPISKLLNPFLNGGGYNLAVALNFTQTKIEMPKTKQTSMSNFFEPQRRILKKMSVLDNRDETASTTAGANSKKRRHDVDTELSEEWKVPEWSHEVKSEAASPVRNRYRSPGVVSNFKDHSEDLSQPQRKKRKNDENLPYDEEPLIKSSKDLLDDFNTKCENTTCLNGCLNCLQTEDDFVFQTPLRTSTQKPSKLCSQEDTQNINSLLSSPSKQASKQASVSQLREITNYLKTASPLKEVPDHLWKETHQDSKRSPIKKPIKHHEDSLSMLFTQDSEGFRVIAHRGHQTQLSPLKHKTQIAKSHMVSKSQIEEEDENPFTQDSQGNIVIKHF